jgi:O-succinylhomoserine sulfhydrylase
VATTWTYPARTSHRRVPEDEQAAMGIGPGLIRVSVGLEDPNDLLEDLAGALE